MFKKLFIIAAFILSVQGASAACVDLAQAKVLAEDYINQNYRPSGWDQTADARISYEEYDLLMLLVEDLALDSTSGSYVARQSVGEYGGLEGAVSVTCAGEAWADVNYQEGWD